jgi:hypothetical protein
MAKGSAPMSREVKAAYREIEKGVDHLARSIKEIRVGLRQAERKIEADARTRVRELRKEARTQSPHRRSGIVDSIGFSCVGASRSFTPRRTPARSTAGSWPRALWCVSCPA